MRVSPLALAVISAAGLTCVTAACSSETPAGSAGDGGSGGSSAGSGGTGLVGSGGFGGSAAIGGSLAIDASGGTGGIEPDAGCAHSTLQSSLLPTNILFVVDRSGSMNCNLPPTTQSAACEQNPSRADATKPSKWEVVSGALNSAFAALPPSTGVGIAFFSNNNVCGVNSQPSVPVALLDITQKSTLGGALGAVVPAGGTPMVGATILAYKYVNNVAQLPGNRFVVVITDGADTCNPESIQTLLDVESAKAVAANIRTFVIGAPGSEPARAVLSQLAYQGGTASSATCDHTGATADVGDCHFDMTTSADFAASLAAALTQISGAALTCEFDLPSSPDGQPVDRDKVNVDYTPGDGTAVQHILQDTTAACDAGADGWQYTDSTQTKVQLCGATCNTVKADPIAKVDIILGCPTQGVH